MEFEFTTLGTASALPSYNKFPSAHVFNLRGRLFLIDCGEGCQMQLKKAGVSILKIDNILISHLHGDHVFGIFGLLSTMVLLGRKAPLYIYAPAAFKGILNFFLNNFADGIQYEIVHTPLKLTQKEKILDMRQAEVYAFPLNHRMDTFGFQICEKMPQYNVRKWRIEADGLTLREIAQLKDGRDAVRENGDVLELSKYAYIPYSPRSFAYCSDTAVFEKESEWLRGTDLLYHEATYADDNLENAVKYFHSTASQAAKIAADAGVRKLVIGHFSSRYGSSDIFLKEARAVFPETYLAEECKTFSIELDKREDE